MPAVRAAPIASPLTRRGAFRARVNHDLTGLILAGACLRPTWRRTTMATASGARKAPTKCHSGWPWSRALAEAKVLAPYAKENAIWTTSARPYVLLRTIRDEG